MYIYIYVCVYIYMHLDTYIIPRLYSQRGVQSLEKNRSKIDDPYPLREVFRALKIPGS